MPMTLEQARAAIGNASDLIPRFSNRVSIECDVSLEIARAFVLISLLSKMAAYDRDDRLTLQIAGCASDLTAAVCVLSGGIADAKAVQLLNAASNAIHEYSELVPDEAVEVLLRGK